MKKLLFATAIAASAAAFAEPINSVNFAGENDYVPNGSQSFFYFDGQSNSSFVTNDTDAASTKHAAYYTNATDKSFLALDTEGGTLWRSLGVIDIQRDPVGETNIYNLGSAQTVAATGTYLDTLVQFTVTEDDAPMVGEGDKLAIWLQADEGTTNLMVKAKAWALEGGVPAGVASSFTVSNVAIEPGAWYRLTVKAVQTIIDPATGMIIPAFQIFIDGTEVAATTPQISTEMQDAFTGNTVWLEGMAALASANKLFPTLAGDPAALTDVTLQGVGFQGTGAVDEIVWTEDNPFPAAPTAVDFTLSWTAGQVAAVSYVLSTDLATTNQLTSGTAVQLAPGDGTATIELIPTFETGYEFDKVTMGETELGLTFAIPGVTTNATLLAKAAAATYPTYIDTSDTTIKGKYDAWKQAVGFDDSSTSTHLNQFLLNVDESATVGDAALEITEIKQNATAGWDITIGCSLDGVGLTGTVGETIVCNGYLAVSYTDSLTGTWTTENIAVTAVDATTGTVTVNVNKANAKFMKVTLTAAPQPAANN